MPRVPAAALFLAALAACSGGPAPALNLGQPAPAFSTPALTAERIDFPAAASGKPVVLRFWADWCRFCEAEMKGIEAVYQRHRSSGVTIYAINVGQDRATSEAFAKRTGITYPMLLDEPSAIAKRYGVVGLPTTYFVDRAGVVRGKIIGEADEATFERELQALLR